MKRGKYTHMERGTKEVTEESKGKKRSKWNDLRDKREGKEEEEVTNGDKTRKKKRRDKCNASEEKKERGRRK